MPSPLKALDCDHNNLIVADCGSIGKCQCGAVVTGSELVRLLMKINRAAFEELEKTRAELEALKAKEAQFREVVAQVIDWLPFPAWFHPVATLDWYLNKAHVERFGIKRGHFWEPVNVMVNYPLSVATDLMRADMEMIQGGLATTQEMSVPGRLLEEIGVDNPAMEIEVTKYPIIVSGEAYVFGRCI